MSQNYSSQAGADMIHCNSSGIEQGRNVESDKGPNLSNNVWDIKNVCLMLFCAMSIRTSD